MAAQNRQGKVLRIGIIQDGNIQERVIKANDPVTIGESPNATFVLPKTGLPSAEFTMFRPTSNGYVLQFTDQMVGKISKHGAGNAKTPVISLKSMISDPSVTRADGIASLPLEEDHRGKITLGAITVLFQFVPPPPVGAVAPIQQTDFRPRLIEEDDPVFLGFLGIWSALGIVLAIWVWRTEPRPFTLDDVPERYVQLIRQTEPQPEPEVVVEDMGREQKREAEKESETDAQKAMKSARSARDRAKAESDRKSELIAGSALLMKYVGTQGDSRNGVVQNLWSDEEQGLGNVDDMLSQASAATGDTVAATRMGNAGGKAAASGSGISRIGGGQGGDVAGPKVTVRPTVNAGAGSVDTVSGDENQVTATVKRYAGQLQYCYEKVLKVDPTLEGRVEIGWSVAGGVVRGMPFVIANTTESGELADCVVKKIRRWEFPPDVEGEMSWPFLFRSKK